MTMYIGKKKTLSRIGNRFVCQDCRAIKDWEVMHDSLDCVYYLLNRIEFISKSDNPLQISDKEIVDKVNALSAMAQKELQDVEKWIKQRRLDEA